MRTRTLLILAAVCLVMILTAGVAQLLRLSNNTGDSTTERVLAVGETAELGALTATAVEVDVTGDLLRVDVELRFADDGVTSLDGAADATTHFRLLAGELRAPDAAEACGALTAPEQRCALTFDTTGAPGGARLLVLEWGGVHARWDVAAGG